MNSLAAERVLFFQSSLYCGSRGIRSFYFRVMGVHAKLAFPESRRYGQSSEFVFKLGAGGQQHKHDLVKLCL